VPRLLAARDEYPDADYVARVFHCSTCSSIDAAVAPRDELPSNYPCPFCGRPQVPVSPLLTHLGTEP
jgi:hypothetical protein